MRLRKCLIDFFRQKVANPPQTLEPYRPYTVGKDVFFTNIIQHQVYGSLTNIEDIEVTSFPVPLFCDAWLLPIGEECAKQGIKFDVYILGSNVIKSEFFPRRMHISYLKSSKDILIPMIVKRLSEELDSIDVEECLSFTSGKDFFDKYLRIRYDVKQ